jgi:hypothetical protein
MRQSRGSVSRRLPSANTYSKSATCHTRLKFSAKTSAASFRVEFLDPKTLATDDAERMWLREKSEPPSN